MKRITLTLAFILSSSFLSAGADHPIPKDSNVKWDFRGKSTVPFAAYADLFKCQTYEELRDALIEAIPTLENAESRTRALQPTRDCHLALIRVHYLLGEVKAGDEVMLRFANTLKLDQSLAASPSPRPARVSKGLEKSGIHDKAKELESRQDRGCLELYAEMLGGDSFSERWRGLNSLRRITGMDFELYVAAGEKARAEPTQKWNDWIKAEGQTAKLNWDK